MGKKKETARLRRPTLAELEAEIQRRQRGKALRKAAWDTVRTLLAVAAIAVLLSTFWLPVLQVFGSSMAPSLQDGETVLSVKQSKFNSGDIIAFYFNNKVLIKRVIAGAGDWVNIDESGLVYVNDQALDEPYIIEKSLGECDIELPYQVPDGKWFVMGDHRATSVDSRSSMVGAISDEQILGRVFFRVWPLAAFGRVN